jgi:tetratricopeptide (TPR) repeat protein
LGSAHQAGSVEAARHAVEIDKDIYGGKPSAQMESKKSILARSMIKEGMFSEAVDELVPAIAETEELLGPKNMLVGYMAYFLGNAKWQLGGYDEAIVPFQKALDIFPAVRQPIILCSIGDVLAAAWRNEAALEQLARAAKLTQDAGSFSRTEVAHCESSRVMVLARLGRLEDADLLLAQINASSALSGDDLMIHKTHESELRSLEGRHAEAIALASDARAHLTPSASPLVKADASFALGRALLAAGRKGEAVEPLKAALDIYRGLKLAQPEDPAAVSAADALLLAQSSR